MITAPPEPTRADHIARIAVPVPLYRLFDYRLPAASPRPGRGCRVRVPFGRKQLVGMVVSVGNTSDYPMDKLKTVAQCIDAQPLLDEEILKLLEWAASYYHYPLGEVIFTALPRQLRLGQAAELKTEPCWCLTEQGRGTSADELKRASKQAAILAYIQGTPRPGVFASELNDRWKNWRVPVQALVDKSLLKVEQKVMAAHLQSAADNGGESAPVVVLNEQQQTAVQQVVSAFSSYQTFLLQGITGSGKTEVYLEIIEQALRQNLQVLVLVPEISLTPQLARRFEARLQTRIVSLHSALNDAQRHTAWLQAASGDARLVIGTRSALFTPMPQLGLIIIDEEHDASLKQQEGFRYHARDLALVRARNRAIPVLLGSATPSLESLENVARQQYRLLQLTRRGVRAAVPPKISLLDVCRRPMEDGLSDPLLEKIDSHLQQDGQVLLFINRRGYAPLLMCHECGWTTACPRCDANMTLHQHNQRLRCHHCGYEKAAPRECPQCQHPSLHVPGAGTERIELALAQKFPGVVMTRIDRDTTRRKGELNKKLELARTGEAKILIGTQMLAKGHDFPNLTLVGILDADQGLFSADFRGTEHMAQLVVQVAGRAGRGEKAGEVIIQTHHPEHPLLHTLLQSGYNGFARQALQERRQAGFPPFSHMAILRSNAIQKDQGRDFLNECRGLFNDPEVQIFGPLPAPMERRAGRYRWQLVLMAAERRNLHAALRQWIPRVGGLKSASRVRWSIDIDPLDMF